ncbi:hypothetical protein HJG54_32065 [Leptolyngbya sp. NK1-12]|uniref:Uncharacterized protein n=1 Tax=Leptolyngbya sp. NK1-12 TaxID=2547451 RepID=A0AA97ASR2_9CYAN|nr:hypothetical protein [Leptolyngbya sp. NK1-12]WNZ27513.1 hypothetical protein HJG54_32065 [Leptolyngbya sp. NK1-12]
MFLQLEKLFSLSVAAVSAAVVFVGNLAAYALTADELFRLNELCAGRKNCQDLVNIAKQITTAQSGSPSEQREQYTFSSGGVTFVLNNTMVEVVSGSQADPGWEIFRLSPAEEFPGSGYIRFMIRGFYAQPNGNAVGQTRIYYGECPDRAARSYTGRGFSTIELESAYEFDAQGQRFNVRGRGDRRPASYDEAAWSYYACYLAYDLPFVQHILETEQVPVDNNPFE